MENSVEKRTIAQFVHDAVEMEAAIYTLDRMEEECKQKNEKLLQNQSKNLMMLHASMKKAKMNWIKQKNKTIL